MFLKKITSLHLIPSKLWARYSSTNTLAKSAPLRRRRSLFSVPGASDKRLTKVPEISQRVDSIVLDLEDGVSHSMKRTGREKVLEALQTKNFHQAEVCVRVNDVHSGLIVDDLLCVLQSENLRTLVIPKVNSSSDLDFVSNFIRDFDQSDRYQGPARTISLLAAIETAQGLINLAEISKSCSGQLEALIFAAEDFCADLGLTRTVSMSEMLYARSKIVLYSKCSGLQAIDAVCIDHNNLELLQNECQSGKTLGFTGKQIIHPNQIQTVNEMFLPSARDLAYAQRIVEGYQETTKCGQGAFVLDGKVIDLPVYKWALAVIAQTKP